MLLTEKVMVKWNVNNRKWYEEKGYVFTKYKQEFECRVEDLTKNNKIQVDVKCELCGDERKMKYCDYYKKLTKNKKYVCPPCAYKTAGDKNKKDPKQFEKEFYDLVGDEYTLLEEYKGANTKILVRHNCDKCGNYEWEITPSKLLNGRRCPKCANNIKKTLEDFKKEVFDKFGDEYTVLGDTYINTDTAIRIRHNCTECGNYEWDVVPKILLKGESRCPKCSKKAPKTTEQFKQEVFNLVGDEYTVLGEYKNCKTKTLMRHNCQECNNHEWEIKPSNFLSGRRCPVCNKSKGEIKIEQYLKQKRLKYVSQKEFDNLIGLGGGNLSYDFYLSSYNLLIEYQGEYHDGNTRIQTKKDVKRQQKHDRRKKQYAINNNIKLLEIWYWDYDNIEEILDKELKDLKDNKDKAS